MENPYSGPTGSDEDITNQLLDDSTEEDVEEEGSEEESDDLEADDEDEEGEAGEEDLEEDETEGEDEDQEAEAKGGDLHEIIIDGEPHQVNTAELKNGYLRQSDYTKKTQELAERRRAFEGERQQFEQYATQGSQHLEGLAQELKSLIETSRRSPEEWNMLRESDLAEYTRQRELETQRMQALQQSRQQQEWLAYQERQARIPREKQELVRKIPGWEDPAVFQREYQKLGRFLINGGHISAEDWDQVVDHRQVYLAYHAMKNIEADTAAPVLRKKIRRKTKPVIRPGAVRTPDREGKNELRQKRAMGRLKKSGRVEDAVDVLLG